MEKKNLTEDFASRLKNAMLAANFDSKRSTSGVCIHKLAEMTGYSVQICRRYLRGEAVPELSKLIGIAETLGVTPGWLLFGDDPINHQNKTADIRISKELLHYLFTQASTLYHDRTDGKEIADFLLELLNDISEINASDEQSKKIIDLAMASIKHFKD